MITSNKKYYVIISVVGNKNIFFRFINSLLHSNQMIHTKESSPPPRRSIPPELCKEVCEGPENICCCCIDGPPRSISNRSPIKESTPGITVGWAPGGALTTSVSAGWASGSSKLPLKK